MGAIFVCFEYVIFGYLSEIFLKSPNWYARNHEFCYFVTNYKASKKLVKSLHIFMTVKLLFYKEIIPKYKNRAFKGLYRK